MSTSITVLSGGYLEVACVNPWVLLPMKRAYVIRRTVDYSRVVWC
jgi:hypothetical protein